MQTLYHVAVKASFYRMAVEESYIPIPNIYFPALIRFVPESAWNHAVILGHSNLMPETQAVDTNTGHQISQDAEKFQLPDWAGGSKGKYSTSSLLKPASTARQ